jgi:hypothetical protein
LRQIVSRSVVVVQEFTLNCTVIPPGFCDACSVHKRAAYIFGYVDSVNWSWLGGNVALRLQRAIMSRAAVSALRGLSLATAAAVVGLSLTNAAHADFVFIGGPPETAFVDLGHQGLEPLGLQTGNGNAVFDLTAADRATLNGAGSSEFLGGLASTLGCAAGAPTACGPSDAGPGSFLGLARSAVATPLPGAVFLFGSVLFGGLGMSARRARRRRNRGAVSLLA